MPPPVYSERFISLADAQLWRYYSPAGGKRAVIRSIIATTGQNTSFYFILAVAGIFVMNHAVPVANSSQVFDVRIPVYAGETFGVWCSGTPLIVTVSGYLFDDPGGQGKPATEDYERPHADILPAPELFPGVA